MQEDNAVSQHMIKSPYMVTGERQAVLDHRCVHAIRTIIRIRNRTTMKPEVQNYIRNSVKVAIDAYNGNTDYYIVDDTDPIAQTFKKIYPDLFKDLDKMPQGIKGAHPLSEHAA